MSDQPPLHFLEYGAQPAKPRYRRVFITLGVIAALFVAGAVLNHVWWYLGFRERLRLADEHALKLQPVLQSDTRFSTLTAGSYTGADGTLIIEGEIPADSLRDLQKLVASTAPPVLVVYAVDEVGATTQPSH